MTYLILMILFSYLLGSVPTSILAGKMLRGRHFDIRKEGSGNAGATNVFRVLGWKAGLIVLLIDMAKGWIPTVWVSQLGIQAGWGWEAVNFQIIAGLCAVLGHIWTIFARFQGGKGVGTGAGMVIGLAPFPVLICVIIFAVVVATTRFVSLGSILASIALPLVLCIQRFALAEPVPNQLLIFSIFIPLLIIYTHRANIGRLMRGEENQIRFGK